jgi:Cyclic-phosphate processing Receiver domain
MKVWLDDRRPPYPEPEEWAWVRAPAEAIELLKTGTVSELSLDHDLGLMDGERELTGYDVVTWIEWAVATQGFVPPQTIRVHSANASAAPKMERGIEAIRNLANRSSGANEQTREGWPDEGRLES